jgi:hypothetical protein
MAILLESHCPSEHSGYCPGLRYKLLRLEAPMELRFSILLPPLLSVDCQLFSCIFLRREMIC